MNADPSPSTGPSSDRADTPPQAPAGAGAQVPTSSHTPHPGDGWVDCTCGQKHWGLHGAAGLLLARRGADGKIADVVLQHRSPSSHLGGTWAIPGGAIGPSEDPVEGALREANEEAGIDAAEVHVHGEFWLDHFAWRYTTVLAELTPGAIGDVRPTDSESLEIVWVPLDEVPDRPLLPAFKSAWRILRGRLETYEAP